MSDDLGRYRSTMRAWLEENLPRRSGVELRTAHEFDADSVAAGKAQQKATWEAGYFGITIPVEYGGQGLSDQHQRIWAEESAAFQVPAPGGIASGVTLGIVLPTVLAYGSEEQKRGWIPRMLSGDEIWVQLLSEPGAGSDLAGLLTRATRDGDVWILNGTKVWSSGAMSADYGICLARSDWDAPKHKGLTWFKVPLHDAQVTVRPIREINGGAEFCEEFLDDVVVTDDMVLGDVNGGWPIANAMLAFERGAGGDHRVLGGGGGRRPLAPDLVELADARGLAGDGAARQLVARGHILDWEQGQLTKRVIQSMMAGKADPTSASLIKLGLGLRDPARAAVAMELAGRTAVAWRDESSSGHAASVNFLNGRIFSIAGGSNQIQRNIVSERLLGLPREPSVDGDKPFRDVLRDAKSWGSRRS
ncbi:MAG TPA: acyl-CoA dehydrogenase family protein [Acidimicrobiales bacterium]|jgi:alkylation response protein AidB-like acyl-CoA dehydrogenase|nr:acyl-CoA dehydrogenase family protein [Acidimicrobiales bacterium]